MQITRTKSAPSPFPDLSLFPRSLFPFVWFLYTEFNREVLTDTTSICGSAWISDCEPTILLQWQTTVQEFGPLLMDLESISAPAVTA